MIRVTSIVVLRKQVTIAHILLLLAKLKDLLVAESEQLLGFLVLEVAVVVILNFNCKELLFLKLVAHNLDVLAGGCLALELILDVDGITFEGEAEHAATFGIALLVFLDG